MKNAAIRALILFLSTILMLTGCSSPNNNTTTNTATEITSGVTEPEEGTVPTTVTESTGTQVETTAPDYSVLQPNEAGKIMIVMFHYFVETFDPAKNNDYTMELSGFRALLQTFYDMNYRLISMYDYLNNNIDVPAGCIPMVFTFDDGSPSQFSFIKDQSGNLKINPDTAVGIMEEFYAEHPDFGLEGTFFVFLKYNVFSGEGTMHERMQYILDKGFEIGNHSYEHVNFQDAGPDAIQNNLGANANKYADLMPGYTMNALSPPNGIFPAEEYRNYLKSGIFEGRTYENTAVVRVGAEPAFSPVNVQFDPYYLARVRSPGSEDVYMDLTWWLEKLTRGEQYISDGDPDIITVPQNMLPTVDQDKIGDRGLVVY